MPVNKLLLDEITAAIGSGIATSYGNLSKDNDVFEGYVWSLVVSAARAEGASISYEDVFGTPVHYLTFRTSPGNIYSQKHPYTHARIVFDGCPELEAHIGVYVTGKSRVMHECDVAVIERREALVCRGAGVHPRNNKLLLAVECKFHAGTLALGLARSFLGLADELNKKNCFLVTNATSASVEKMVTYHRNEWETGLDLKDPSIPNNLRSRVARVFRDFKAARRP